MTATEQHKCVMQVNIQQMNSKGWWGIVRSMLTAKGLLPKIVLRKLGMKVAKMKK